MPSRLRPRSASQRGFTLIELMVTLTIMVVMLGIGVPSFKNFMAVQRVKSAAFDVATALMLARSEAVKRNKTVTLAPVAAGNWTSGWAVTESGTALMQQEPVSGMSITASAGSLTYQPNGRVGASTSFELASTVYPDAGAKRCVKVDLTGVPSTSTGACPP